MPEDSRHWLRTIAPPDSDLYYATLFTPRPLRDALLALLGIAQTLRRIPFVTEDPGLARIKLAWWREELAGLASGRARHPLSSVLTTSAGLLDAAGLRAITDAAESAFEAPPKSFAAWIAESRALHAPLWLSATRLGGLPDPAAPLARAISTLAGALGLHDSLHTLPAAARRGLVRLPADALRERGIGAHALLQADESALHDLFAQVAQEIRQQVQDGLAMLPRDGHAAMRAQLVLIELLSRTLAAEQQTGYRYHRQRVLLNPLRRAWLAWRVHRRLCR